MLSKKIFSPAICAITIKCIAYPITFLIQITKNFLKTEFLPNLIIIVRKCSLRACALLGHVLPRLSNTYACTYMYIHNIPSGRHAESKKKPYTKNHTLQHIRMHDSSHMLSTNSIIHFTFFYFER